jgi:chloramphenicol O-acetyltransferase
MLLKSSIKWQLKMKMIVFLKSNSGSAWRVPYPVCERTSQTAHYRIDIEVVFFILKCEIQRKSKYFVIFVIFIIALLMFKT